MEFPLVKPISECYIKPKYEVHEFKLPYYLSPFDLVFLSCHYNQKGLLFAKPNNPQDFDIHKFLETLKDALAHTLVHFYPLAGQLDKIIDEDQHKMLVFIDCNKGSGARFVHAKLDIKMSDITTPIHVPEVVKSFFDHENGDKVVNYDGISRPLLSIQVTELIDGVFIGCTMNHLPADGTSYWHFWNIWSEIHCAMNNGDENISISRQPIHKRWVPHGYGTNDLFLPYVSPDEFIYSTAEKTNIPWRNMTKEILESDVYKELESVRNPNVVYPDYYLNPFHAYDEGNLSWLAAAEAEPASMSITRRAIPDASSLDEAIDIVRGNWLRQIEQHLLQYSGNSTVSDILDIGCSVGWSTRFLAMKFPSANVTGLDLSPYFLAVAQYKEKNRPSGKRIKWVHANAEDTGLPAKSFDLVSIAYVLHECPAKVTVNLVKEAFRLLRPGGTIAITDNSPKSKKLQELSPVLFTLVKSTEPFLDEYYLLDLEAVLREARFVHIQTVLTDPRHRTVTATVPY